MLKVVIVIAVDNNCDTVEKILAISDLLWMATSELNDAITWTSHTDIGRVVLPVLVGNQSATNDILTW